MFGMIDLPTEPPQTILGLLARDFGYRGVCRAVGDGERAMVEHPRRAIGRLVAHRSGSERR